MRLFLKPGQFCSLDIFQITILFQMKFVGRSEKRLEILLCKMWLRVFGKKFAKMINVEMNLFCFRNAWTKIRQNVGHVSV